MLFLTNLGDRTEWLCACCKAPFYCVCQGQSGKRYVRNSHVSCPHSSIGAAVPLPGETQKANFAFISLRMQPGYFYSCIVRRVQRLQLGEAAQVSKPARAACSGGERGNESFAVSFLLHLSNRSSRFFPAPCQESRCPAGCVRPPAFPAGASQLLAPLWFSLPPARLPGSQGPGKDIRAWSLLPHCLLLKGLACFLRHTSPSNTNHHKHQNLLSWLYA